MFNIKKINTCILLTTLLGQVPVPCPTKQQAKEKELTERMQRLQSLEAEYAQQIQERTVNESKKMTDAIYNFIREYNLQNQQFDLILARSYTSSPILYGNEGMDITDEIVKGLNEEYEKVKADQ